MSVKPETGDRLAGNLATISRFASVVKTRPVSFEWFNQYEANLPLTVRPSETSLCVLVGKEEKWKTSL